MKDMRRFNSVYIDTEMRRGLQGYHFLIGIIGSGQNEEKVVLAKSYDKEEMEYLKTEYKQFISRLWTDYDLQLLRRTPY